MIDAQSMVLFGPTYKLAYRMFNVYLFSGALIARFLSFWGKRGKIL